MSRNIISIEMRNIYQWSTEELKSFVDLMKTGECIGGMDLGGKHYQLWDYKTSQQSKRPSDVIVGVWIDNWEYAYFYIKRSSLVRLN